MTAIGMQNSIADQFAIWSKKWGQEVFRSGLAARLIIRILGNAPDSAKLTLSVAEYGFVSFEHL